MSIKEARRQFAIDRTDLAHQEPGQQVNPATKRAQAAKEAAAAQALAEDNAKRQATGVYPKNSFGDLMTQVYEHDVAMWKGGRDGITAGKFMSVMHRFVRCAESAEGPDGPGSFVRKDVRDVSVTDINDLRQRVLRSTNKLSRQGNKTALQQALRFVGSVMDEAIDRKLIEMTPVVEPKRKNAKRKTSASKSKHHPGVTTLPLLGRLVRSIMVESMPSRFDARDAMFLTLATAQRRYTIINMEWIEIRWDAAEWVIPREKMKRCGDEDQEAEDATDHIVPLSKQCMDLLTMRWKLREQGRRKSPFVFPSRTIANDRGPKACGMSNTMMSEMLNDGHELGLPSWKGIHSPHGSRTTFRTLAPQVFGDYITVDGLHFDTAIACEIQLAHTHGEAMKERTANMPGVYAKGDMLDQRRVIMQKWSDPLERLANEAEPEDHAQMRLAGERAMLQGPGPALLAA